MSMNSFHQLNQNMNGGFYASETTHEQVVANVLNQNYVFARNYKNAGYTAFDEETVQVGYMKASGRGSVAGPLIGYRGPLGSQTSAVKKRVRNMGAHKVRAMHESMKEYGLVPAMFNGQGAEGGGGRHPLFFAFERLLQLFFPDYEALPIPQRIRNWVPTEGSFYYHWWIERNIIE